MNLQTEKIELVKMLLDIEDETLIKEIKALVKTHEEDFYVALPQHVKDGVKTSRKQAEEGKIHPLEDVISRLSNK